MPMLKVSPWMDGMIFAKSASRYSASRPRVAATAFTRSTSKPTILPLGSLNSLGAYGMLTPTISFPDDLIASGTVFAIASTFSAVTDGAALDDSLDPESLPAEQPDTARVADAAKIAATRHIVPRRISDPPDTVVSTFCIGQLTYGRLVRDGVIAPRFRLMCWRTEFPARCLQFLICGVSAVKHFDNDYLRCCSTSVATPLEVGAAFRVTRGDTR